MWTIKFSAVKLPLLLLFTFLILWPTTLILLAPTKSPSSLPPDQRVRKAISIPFSPGSHAIPFNDNATQQQPRQLDPQSSDEEWQALICKGTRLMEMMRLSPEEAESQGHGDSIWTDYGALEQTGWSLRKWMWFPGPRMVEVEATLGVKFDRSGYQMQHMWEHKGTAAAYLGVYSPKEGYMIMVNNHGPRHTHKGRTEPSLIPNLNQLSDVYYLQWRESQQTPKATTKTTPPKYIIRESIANEVTKRAITRARAQVLASEGWPGFVVYPRDEEFKALMGTPNGLAAAWFLAQHKKELGVWEVKSIMVWGRPANMVQEVGEVKGNEGPGRGLGRLVRERRASKSGRDEVSGFAPDGRARHERRDSAIGSFDGLTNEAPSLLKGLLEHGDEMSGNVLECFIDD